MRIVLNRDDVKRAAEYTRMAAGRFPESDVDGDRIRTPEEIQGHVLMGRLGELAFLRYLEGTGITIQTGREVLPVGTWDVDDVSFRGWSMDVKCTGADSQNLLLQRSKLDYRRMAGELPHYFVAVKLVEACPSLEECLGGQSEIVIELKGYMDTRKLATESGEVFAVQKGELVPDGTLKVKTTDFVVPFSKLSKNWKFLVDSLQKDEPFAVNVQNTVEGVAESPLPAKYSLCLLGNEAEKYATDEGVSQLAYWLRQGIKIQLFLPNGSKKKDIFQALVDCFKADKSILNLCFVYEADGKIPSAKVVDGQVSETIFNAWKEAVPAFNIEQFEIEHFPVDKPLIVKAGAGTGKTAVMVDRVLFLLSTAPQLKVSDIAMITFTREAAKNMRDRIASALMERFRQTGQYRYLEWMEQLGDMQISTIDSFFKTIISKEGLELGYGADVRVRGMVHEKKKILQDVMTKEFPVHAGQNMLDSVGGLPDYEYDKLVMKCWDKLDSWGVYLESIENMEFGHGAGENAENADKINIYLQKVLIAAERNYRQLKKKTNSLAVNDLKEELDQLSQLGSSKLAGMNFRFLFVDEFQDTDSSQINTLVWLSEILKCQLFVVGDVKQSIYRFRGAEATAFLQLKHALKEKRQVIVTEKNLVRNYRTASNVLNNLNEMFNKWDLLDAEPVSPSLMDEDGRLKRGIIECIPYRVTKNNTNLQLKTISLLQRLLTERKMKEKEKQNKKIEKSDVICILNRTNRQVQETAAWCQESGIPVAAVMEGGFYQCCAVQDIVALLRVLLYPEDPRAVFNFLLSSYSEVQPDIERIQELAGREDDLLKYLLQEAERSRLQDLLRASRRKSFFQLIREIIQFRKPEDRFYALRQHELKGKYKNEALETQLMIEYKSYQLNLRKLLKIFYNSFRRDRASILAVYDFLVLKQNTERKEDALTAQPDGDYVVAMTVHKSKGLEYDTVIIPMTNKLFYTDPENQDDPKDRVDFLLTRTKPFQFGWRLIKKGTTYKNSVFEQELRNENQDNATEEARILYVALTRVQNQLYYFIPEKVQSNTWAELLVKGEIKDGGRN